MKKRCRSKKEKNGEAPFSLCREAICREAIFTSFSLRGEALLSLLFFCFFRFAAQVIRASDYLQPSSFASFPFSLSRRPCAATRSTNSLLLTIFQATTTTSDDLQELFLTSDDDRQVDFARDLLSQATIDRRSRTKTAVYFANNSRLLQATTIHGQFEFPFDDRVHIYDRRQVSKHRRATRQATTASVHGYYY
jgi:hypothetical protein